MSNMSYCKFRNTLGDLRDCYDCMDEPCSEEETLARYKLVQLCYLIAQDYSVEGVPVVPQGGKA